MVLDHGRISVTMPALRGDRLSGQGILIVLLGLAFAAILLARLTGGGVPAVVADASPTPGVTGVVEGSASPPRATTRPTRSSAPSGASSSPDAGSAPPGSAQPSNVAPKTYKIKAGDTLIGIAAKFSTTPKAIANLNGITNPAALKVGQVLKIP